MASAFQGLEFVIDCSRSNIVLRNKLRINSLFKVVISFKEKDDDVKQWIHVDGNIDECYSAKNYITALTSPECRSCVQGMRLHPLFTKKRREEIERTTHAVLTLEDNSDDLRIYGTDQSVARAKTLINDLLSQNTRETLGNTQGTLVSPARQSTVTTHVSPSVSSLVSTSGQRTKLQDTTSTRPNLHQHGQGFQQKENYRQKTYPCHTAQQDSRRVAPAQQDSRRAAPTQQDSRRAAPDRVSQGSTRDSNSVINHGAGISKRPIVISDDEETTEIVRGDVGEVAANPIVISDGEEEDMDVDSADTY